MAQSPLFFCLLVINMMSDVGCLEEGCWSMVVSTLRLDWLGDDPSYRASIFYLYIHYIIFPLNVLSMLYHQWGRSATNKFFVCWQKVFFLLKIFQLIFPGVSRGWIYETTIQRNKALRPMGRQHLCKSVKKMANEK